MGSKRSAYAPGAMLRLLVSLAGLNLCCLCLAPVARADWGAVYCQTTAVSLDVATAKAEIARYIEADPKSPHGLCCQANDFASHCTTFWTAQSGVHFDMCGSLRCDDCIWISGRWQQVVDTCAQNYDGVDRVAGFVSYDWSPGFWNHYGF